MVACLNQVLGVATKVSHEHLDDSIASAQERADTPMVRGLLLLSCQRGLKEGCLTQAKDQFCAMGADASLCYLFVATNTVE
eukprot:6393290-Amphidinium_carterae.1